MWSSDMKHILFKKKRDPMQYVDFCTKVSLSQNKSMRNINTRDKCKLATVYLHPPFQMLQMFMKSQALRIFVL